MDSWSSQVVVLEGVGCNADGRRQGDVRARLGGCSTRAGHNSAATLETEAQNNPTTLQILGAVVCHPLL